MNRQIKNPFLILINHIYIYSFGNQDNNDMGNNNYKIQDFDKNKKVPDYFTDFVVSVFHLLFTDLVVNTIAKVTQIIS